MNAQPEQRTTDWHEGRKRRITASRVGAILGLSKYRTSDDVMREMVRDALGAEREFTGNEATSHGEAHEADALAEYERITGTMVEPCGLVVHPGYDWLGVSPDGLVGADGLVECKCPFRARYMTPSDEYTAQMQLQMAVTGRAWCDFAIWRAGEPLTVVRVMRNDLWLGNNMAVLGGFMRDFISIIEHVDLAAPYLAPKERADRDWRDAANSWAAAKAALDSAKQREEHARATLIELAPAGAKGCGLTLSKVETEGRTDYKRAITQMLPDVDLSPFKGKPSISYRITGSNA